ncbi:MAG: hypothetical protein RIC36_05035 [Rhodospirillales bacterium]
MSDHINDPRSFFVPSAETIGGTFEPALEKLRKFREEKAATEQLIADIRQKAAEIESVWDEIGDCRKAGVWSVVLQIAKRHGPRILAWIGGPGAGAAATALIADDGAFSRLAEIFSRLF